MNTLKLKKLVGIILALVLCLSFAACKKSETSDATDAANASVNDASGQMDVNEPSGTKNVQDVEIDVLDGTSSTTEPVSTYPDNLNDGSVPAYGDPYRADLNKLALVESLNSAFAVQATAAKYDDRVKVTVQNNLADSVSNVKVAFVGLGDKGAIVDCAKNPGYSMTIDTSNRPTKDCKSYVFEDAIAAGDYADAFFQASGETVERIVAIVASYEANGKTVQNPNEADWMYAIFYSDSRRSGTEETLQEAGSSLIVSDVNALKSAAEQAFALDLEGAVIYYNYNGIGANMNLNRDTIVLTLKNDSYDKITSFKLYNVGLRSDDSRVQLWSEIVSSAVTTGNQYLVDGLGVLTCTVDGTLSHGDVTSLTFDCDCTKFSDYSVIVASYTTADGTVVKNPSAEQWLSTATNGEITRESN